MGYGKWFRGGGPSKAVPEQASYVARLQYFSNRMSVNPEIIPEILNGDYSSTSVDILCTWVTTPFDWCLEEECTDPNGGHIPDIFFDMLTLYQVGRYSGEEFHEWENEWEEFLAGYGVDVWDPPRL